MGRESNIICGVYVLDLFANGHNLVGFIVVSPLNSSPTEMRLQIVISVKSVFLEVVYLRAYEQVVLWISTRDILEVEIVQLVVPLMIAS